MKPTDPDDRPGEAFNETLGGLEHLARQLDAGQYPGQAWPTARRLRYRRSVWKFVVSAAAVAALVALALHSWRDLPKSKKPAPGDSSTIARAPLPGQTPASGPSPTSVPPADESTPLRIVIVEDADSYSIIDLTNDRPVVSFASKEAPDLEEMMPVVLDWPREKGL